MRTFVKKEEGGKWIQNRLAENFSFKRVSSVSNAKIGHRRQGEV